MLGDDLEAWLAGSALMKRTFRTCAIIAGLIERRFPGRRKSRRARSRSRPTCVYDVLRRHQPDHILLRARAADAATGLLDIGRLGEMPRASRGRSSIKALDHVSPLAVPVMLEIGREPVSGEASEAVLAEAAEAELVKEAMNCRCAVLHDLSVAIGGSRMPTGRRRRAPRAYRAGARTGSEEAEISPTRGGTCRRACFGLLIAKSRGAALLADAATSTWSPTCIWRKVRG